MSCSVFKITVVQYWLYDCWLDEEGRPCAKDTPGTRFVKSRKVPAGTPGAEKVTKKSTKWYGRVPGNPRPVPLSSNKVAALQLLAQMIRKAELGRAGISDPFEGHRKRPLTEHLADYRRELEARDNAPRYVDLVISRLEALLDGCAFRFTSDLSASRAMDWLAALRQQGRPRAALPAGKELFTPREVGRLLGVKTASVGAAVRRNRLAAEGNGKARRFPRDTVEALQDRLARGASVQTTNDYLSALKSFGRWLVKDRRMAESPFAHLEGGNARVDRRHDRRELEADELRRVLAAARDSARPFCGLTGTDRYHLYATACGTGFRASALASLTPESFDLGADTPTVTLPARHAKNRRTKVQPIPPDLADLLRVYLDGKPAARLLWGGTWARDRRGAQMLRGDLDAAGIPYAVEGPDGPLFADFHALRHTYLTLGGRAGIDLRTLQELAGHSTPTLTARYSHRRLHDLAGAVEKLPRFLPKDRPEAEALRATGTDPAPAPVCTGFAQADDTGREFLRLTEAPKRGEGGKGVGPNTLTEQGVEADCDRLRLSATRAGDGARTHDSHVGKLAAQPFASPGNRSPHVVYERSGVFASAVVRLRGIASNLRHLRSDFRSLP
jgi:integrase